MLHSMTLGYDSWMYWGMFSLLNTIFPRLNTAATIYFTTYYWRVATIQGQYLLNSAWISVIFSKTQKSWLCCDHHNVATWGWSKTSSILINSRFATKWYIHSAVSSLSSSNDFTSRSITVSQEMPNFHGQFYDQQSVLLSLRLKLQTLSYWTCHEVVHMLLN